MDSIGIGGNFFVSRPGTKDEAVWELDDRHEPVGRKHSHRPPRAAAHQKVASIGQEIIRVLPQKQMRHHDGLSRRETIVPGQVTSPVPESRSRAPSRSSMSPALQRYVYGKNASEELEFDEADLQYGGGQTYSDPPPTLSGNQDGVTDAYSTNSRVSSELFFDMDADESDEDGTMEKESFGGFKDDLVQRTINERVDGPIEGLLEGIRRSRPRVCSRSPNLSSKPRRPMVESLGHSVRYTALLKEGRNRAGSEIPIYTDPVVSNVEGLRVYMQRRNHVAAAMMAHEYKHKKDQTIWNAMKSDQEILRYLQSKHLL